MKKGSENKLKIEVKGQFLKDITQTTYKKSKQKEKIYLWNKSNIGRTQQERIKARRMLKKTLQQVQLDRSYEQIAVLFLNPYIISINNLLIFLTSHVQIVQLWHRSHILLQCLSASWDTDHYLISLSKPFNWRYEIPINCKVDCFTSSSPKVLLK